MPDNHTQQRVYHYRSSAITNSEIEKPNANNLDFGEIAINYNAQEPSLFIKQNDSEIAQFVDKKYIEDNINSLSGLNDVNISSPMEEQSLVYDSVSNEYINKYALAGAIPYGVCDDTSTSTNFTATVKGITELRDGTCMLLKNGVVTSASGFKINVNDLGAKPVYGNLASATSETTLFDKNYTILFIYDETRVSGGCWIYYKGYDANTTYTNVKLGQGYASSTATTSSTAKTATLASYTLTDNGIVSVKFSGDVPANATLNINSKGEKQIYYKGNKITNGVIKAGDTSTFMYNTYYHLLTIDRWNSDFSGNYNDLTNKPELSTVATSGNYNDLSNKPTIGNGALTIKRNGTSLGSFSANQTDNKEIDISVPTKTSDLTNDSNFITSAVSALTYFATSADVVTALANKSDIFMCEFNGTALTPSVDEIYEAYLDGKVILCKHQENHSYGDEDVISYMTSIKYDPELSGEYTGYIQFIGVHEDNNEDNEPFVYQIIGVQYDNTPWTFEYEELGNLYIALHYAHYHANKTILDKIPNSISGKAGKVLTVNSASNGLSFESIPTSLSAMTNDAGFITSAVTNLTNFATSSNTVSALNNKVDKVSGKGLSTNDFSNAYKGKLDNIASGAEVNVQSDWNVSDSNSDAYIKNKPTIGNAALTIQKNGTNVGSFSANQTTNKTINIAVPTTASDVNALPDSTKYAASLSLDINSSTYVVTAQLKDQEGNNLGTQQTIDLPLETMVVSGSYISSAKTVSLVLQNGNKIEFSVADLVSGLQTEITDSNKLSADLIENGNTNKIFTSSEKTKLSNLASSLATTSASGYMSSTQVTKLNGIESGAEVNVQSDWNETNSGSDAYIKNKPTIPTTTSQLTNDSGFITASDVPQELFICNISQQMVDGQLVYSCDKTWSEIYAAHQSGKLVLLLAISTVFTPSVIQPNGGSFESDRYSYFEGVGGVYYTYNLTYTTSTNEWKFIYGAGYEFSQSYKEKLDSISSGAQANVQSDWNETNSGSDAYILNKPTKLSQLTNDSGFITSAVTSLKNYATSANVVSELDKKVETFECEFTMTMDSSSQEEFPYNCTIICDKTVNEISLAAANGKKILAKCDISNMFAELSGVQYISYWEITNNIYNGENAYVAFDVDMIMVHFSVFGYGEDNLWEISGAVNSNDLDKVHNLQPVATAGTIGDLNDVAIYNSASSGQILQYDGTNWVNETLPSMPDVSNFITSAVTDLQFFATSSATVDALNNKVDKETGKGLSTNDFTNAYKGKLDGIASGAQVNGNAYSTIQVNGTTTNLVATTSGDTFIISAGTNVTLTSDSKKVIISALDTLPGTLTTTATTSLSATTNESLSGSVSLHKVAKTGSYNDLNDKPNLNEVISITYAELKQLKDSSGLTPNQQYRITNYHTYNHNYFGDGVANHDFDLIVRAISNNQLDVKASATQHNGDTYFSGISLNLWEIWYDLDANASINHTGLIYRMIDEYGNDCCYDFKNLLFYRKLNNDGLYDENGTNKLCYTFSIFSGGTCYDATHFPTMVNALHEKAIWGAGNCRVSFNKMFGINNVLLCAGGEYAQYCYIYNNTFEDFAYSNTIVCNAYLYNNTFKAYCTGITFNRTTSFEGNVFYPNTSGLKVTATNNDLTFYRNTVKSLTNVNITITSNDWRAYVVKDCLFKNISGATINNTSSLLSMTISQNSKQEVKIYNEADLVL